MSGLLGDPPAWRVSPAATWTHAMHLLAFLLPSLTLSRSAPWRFLLLERSCLLSHPLGQNLDGSVSRASSTWPAGSTRGHTGVQASTDRATCSHARVHFLSAGESQAMRRFSVCPYVQGMTSRSLRASGKPMLFPLSVTSPKKRSFHVRICWYVTDLQRRSELGNSSFLNSASLPLTSGWYAASMTSQCPSQSCNALVLHVYDVVTVFSK